MASRHHWWIPVVLGGLCVGLVVALARTPPDASGIETTSAFGPTGQIARRPYSRDYAVTDVGCAPDLSAAGLEAFFAARLGPIMGHDSPRIYPLGGARYLWLLQDAFIDYGGSATALRHAAYVNSSALVQEGSCFTMLQRGHNSEVQPFEPGAGESWERYYWPAGGALDGHVLRVFWTEMLRDDPNKVGPLDGIALHPIRTWVATYDTDTLQRLSFMTAPSAGTNPIYGFDAVDGGDGWTYLFGNTFAQNLSREGGINNGPHSATRMWLARVPRGRLDLAPEYRTADGWSLHASEARPISQRFWIENAMRPVLIDDRWVAVTKADGFLGTDLIVDTADHPWGPWTTVATIPATPRGDPQGLVTYAPIVMPWTDPSGEVIVGLSQIEVGWQEHDGGDPAKYRPRYFAVPFEAPGSSAPSTTGG